MTIGSYIEKVKHNIKAVEFGTIIDDISVSNVEGHYRTTVTISMTWTVPATGILVDDPECDVMDEVFVRGEEQN